jgi:hypothetical protein
MIVKELEEDNCHRKTSGPTRRELKLVHENVMFPSKAELALAGETNDGV